jgi:hypothetical protein
LPIADCQLTNGCKVLEVWLLEFVIYLDLGFFEIWKLYLELGFWDLVFAFGIYFLVLGAWFLEFEFRDLVFKSYFCPRLLQIIQIFNNG